MRQMMLLALALAVAALSAARGLTQEAKPAPSAAADADDTLVVIRLRAAASVVAQRAALADVLVFDEAGADLAAALGESPIGPGVTGAGRFVLSHAQMRTRLEELGVNMSRVLLLGARECALTVVAPPDEPAAAAAPLLGERSEGAAQTLAEAIRARLNSEFAAQGGTAEAEFERSGAAFLELTTPQWEFAIRSQGNGKLGLREFRVTLRRDGQPTRTVTVAADVRLSRRIVVARRPLNVGQFVRAEDLKLETRLFADNRDMGVERTEPLVGQQVKRFVAPGDMVRPADLKPVDIVQRSRPVTVVGGGGGIALQLSGVALDSGTFGETVRVRVGEGRKQRREVRGVVTGVATVRLTEEQ